MKTTKRYVLTNERDPSEKLRRIKRCVDGELGGFIESEENLPQSENGWVSGNAQVSGDARVSGNARVSGDAQVFGYARVFGYALVSGYAQVSGDARVSGNARVSSGAQVFGNARVSGYALVSGHAQVSGNARVSGHAQVSGGEWESSPIQIEFCKHFVTNSAPGKITIGCQTHSFSDWLKYYKLIGKRSGYSPTEIQQYGSIIRLIVKIGV